MKYKAKYGAESEIPAEVKAFYTMQGGEWVFQGSEFEGLPELLNPSLAKNRDDILEEKRVAIEAKKLAENKVIDLEREVGTLKQPGTIAISPDEKKAFDEYKEIGPVKDIKAKMEDLNNVTGQLAQISTREEVRTLAKNLKLNEDALIDFKINHALGKDLNLTTIERKKKDDKGQEVKESILAVKTSTNENGTAKESITDFSEYATQNKFPQYLVDQIYNATAGPAEEKKKFRTAASMSSKTESSDDSNVVKSKTQSFNERRSTRQLPWSTNNKSE
jgi:hypothetical protein